MPQHPSDDQLLDLFNQASPGMLVTDADGRAVLANKAARELLGADATAPGKAAAEALGVTDYTALADAGVTVENRKVSFPDTEFPSGYANIGFGELDGRTYGFWALRPTTTHPTPSGTRPEDLTGSATSWIRRVERNDPAYEPATADALPFLHAYYDSCPVAIHLIEADGTVGHANWKDIAIVGATEDPDRYVGHHIRNIYADKEIVEDFLGRWDEDSPIIDFRADFLNKDERVPVVIFSTAHVVDSTLHNTRCFVFADSEPSRPRDRVAALDLDF
ncbi:PAS domain-containing protein [Micromonospora lupini]|uniref:PAS domain-containing protein n=1 Tax=Micromonospora lupini TaxID=285679 RepID=UPI003403C95E